MKRVADMDARGIKVDGLGGKRTGGAKKKSAKKR